MNSQASPYTKSLEDELDWKTLDQLYGVVSQISNFCFETKKFCVTTQFIVLAFFAKLAGDKLDKSLFVVGIAIPVCFWFLDAVAYYYQVKLRGAMESIRDKIAERNGRHSKLWSGAEVIASNRFLRPLSCRIKDALFNHSMWIYALLVAGDLVAWWVFSEIMVG